MPVAALIPIVAIGRKLSYGACRRLGWACVASLVLIAALWLVSCRSILYVAPWKGEYFVMDGVIWASPAGRRGYFDVASYVNHHSSTLLNLWPVETPYYRHVGEPVAFLVPLWIPAAVLFAAALTLFFRKIQDNICKHCRYDLTGNTSGVCPECGTAVKTPAKVEGPAVRATERPP